MKLKYLTLSIVILLTSLFNDLDIQENKTSLLCNGKWYMNYMESGEMKIPVTDAEKKNMWMIFYKDGKHEVKARGGQKKVEIGLWKFTKNKDSIIFTTESGNTKPMKLTSLTKKELGLTFNESGKEMSVYLEK